METFTYKDYLNYLKYKESANFLEIQKELYKKENQGYAFKKGQNYSCNGGQTCVCEEETSYDYLPQDLPQEPINHKHDKMFRTVLDNKNEVAELINKALALKYTIKPEELEKYNSSFVTKELRNQEADIVYKLKHTNIFFLIEHQTKIDYSMAYRILQYEVEIIKSAIDSRQMNKQGYHYPTIYPIVIYSGKNKWNSKLYIKELQENLKDCETIEIGRYNIVDVNDYSEEELLEDASFLFKIMLIEKTVHTEKLPIYLEKIIKEVRRKENHYTDEQKELLNTIIITLFRTELTDSQRKGLSRELNVEEGENMLEVLKMVERENARIKASGVREGVKKGINKGILKEKMETATKMLKRKMDIETIMEITNLTEKQIMKLKEQA